MTHLLDPLCVVKGRVIHNKNRLWLRPSTTQRQQLFNEIFKNGTVCGALKDACENNTILCICWQYLIPLLTLELGYLDWSHTQRGPASPSKPNPFIAARFIHVHQVIQPER
jgi:hypothetical protein